jgi:hypothetical protein
MGHDDDRAVRVMDHLAARRAHHQAGESAAATRADHQQVSVAGSLDELTGRVAADRKHGHRGRAGLAEAASRLGHRLLGRLAGLFLRGAVLRVDDRVAGPVADGDLWTASTVSGRCRAAAIVIAHSSACEAWSDPSTPTMIPGIRCSIPVWLRSSIRGLQSAGFSPGRGRGRGGRRGFPGARPGAARRPGRTPRAGAWRRCGCWPASSSRPR